MRTIRRTVLLLSLSVATLTAQAQSGRIQGRILEAGTNEPLIGATVLIQGTTQGASADIDGFYRILNVRPGTYTLEFRYVGFSTRILENVLVRTDLTTEINIDLALEAFRGQEVIVQADREVVIRDLTSSESRVSRDQIDKLPVQELRDIIQLQAGVTVGPGGSIHIRGGRSSEVAYIVDGVRVTDDYDRSSGLRVENSAIEELQIVSGTFNAEYGQAMSGIVNIVSRSGGNRWQSSINIWGGDYGTVDQRLFAGTPGRLGDANLSQMYNIEGNLSGPIIKDKLTIFLTARRFQNNGYLNGFNAFSPRGPIVPDIDQDQVTLRWERGYNEVPEADPVNKYGDRIDFDKPWYQLHETVTIGGVNYIRYRDLGFRDSAMVAMTPYNSWSGQTNIQWNASKKLRFNLIGSYGRESSQGYSHSRRLVPGGRGTSVRSNYYINFKTTFTPSANSFMTANLATRYNASGFSLYESPYDPRYLNYDRVSSFPADFQGGRTGFFSRFGTDNNFFDRYTQSFIAKVELSSQLNRQHFIKSGIEFQTDIMDFQSYGLQPLSVGGSLMPFPANLDPALVARLELGVPQPNTPGHEKWTRKPVLFAAFLQDKIEYDDLIINAGIRFDYFQSNGRLPADSEDPDLFLPYAERPASFWTSSKAKYAVSPRLGVAYPISSKGVIHFSYGYFFQIPDYNRLYNGEQILLQQTSGVQGVFGNPNLNPERSIKYEIGLQQEVFEGIALNMTAFYEDKRDYVSSGPLQNTSIPSVRYGTWVNRDYANIRGLTMALNQRVSGNVTVGFDYTFSIAEDSNSDPASEFFANVARGDTTGAAVAKFLTPANWDRSHVFNSSLFYSGKNWGFNVLQRFSTGLPYTPGTDIPRRTGISASGDVITNSARMPFIFSLDLNLYTNFNVAGTQIRTFLNVYNLLDSRNVNFVYNDSGVPTGPLRPVQTFESLYYENPTAYSEPRRVQMGLSFGF
jgi:outer membrane receptor for ferrienterochelin and colicin